MDIRTLQEIQQRLIKSPRFCAQPDSHPYERDLAQSPSLAVVRDIARWWRAYQLELYCLITSGLLQVQGDFDAAVADFFESTPNVPAWIEEAGNAFLAFIARRPDPVAASLAQFEAAMIAAKQGELPAATVINWGVHPYEVLRSALSQKIPQQYTAGRFQTLVSSNIEGYFTVFEMN